MRFQSFRSPRTAQNRPERAPSRSEPLRIAQSAPRAAQSRPERSLRAVRGTAQGRPEPFRVAQSGRSGSPRARPELLRLKSRSESHGVCPEPLRVAQSCSKNRSGSSVSHALCISDLSFTSPGSLFSVHDARVRASIYPPLRNGLMARLWAPSWKRWVSALDSQQKLPLS